MRILAIDQYGELAGAQRCFLDAVGGFVARGWEVHAAAPWGPLLEKLDTICTTSNPLECGPFTSGRKTALDAVRFAQQWRHQIARLRSLAREKRIDIFYVNGPRLLPTAVHAAGSRPVVFHAHSIVPQAAAALLVRLAVLWGNVSIIASSRFAAAGFAIDLRSIVHNGVAPFSNHSAERQGIRTIAVVGRISPEKGQLAFVRAAAILGNSLPHVRFVICGSARSSQEAYGHLVAHAAAEAHVAIEPWVDDQSALFAGIDLLVVPSEPVENTPRVILEAYSAGVPVLAYSAGGIPELVDDGRTGILVRPQTPEALAQSIREAVMRPDRMSQIAATALTRWRREFTLERFQAAVCDVVDNAMRRHQRIPAQITGAKARQW